MFCAHAVSVHLLDLERSAAVVHFSSCRPCGIDHPTELRVLLDIDALMLLRNSADHAITEMGGEPERSLREVRS
jgi:hypothetical protein